MKQPVGSVATEVPDGWQTTQTEVLAEFQEPGGNRAVLRVRALGNETQTPEAFVRSYVNSTKSTFSGYQEKRLSGRRTDTAKNKPYADWEFTFQDRTQTKHRLLRVYGATFDRPDQPVAWAIVDLTAPSDLFESRKAIFERAVDKITWDE